MKTTIINTDLISYPEETWRLLFKPSGDNALLQITKNAKDIVRIATDKHTVTCEILFDARETPLKLRCDRNGDISLINLGHRIELRANGKLCDEEWPIGSCVLDGAKAVLGGASVRLSEPGHSGGDEPEVLRTFKNAQGFRPEGDNTNVGDCMPFFHDGTYHLYYLFDRRHHKSKWGLGAHQWAHISTQDLVTWREHPMAVCIDDRSEGSICTGSVIYHNGRYYAFYAVRTCDGSPAKLSWAVSSDGIRFEKSRRELCLRPPYNGPSARDPKVFRDESGIFHMLVTTAVENNSRGALAHLVSTDLEGWEQLSPFITLDISDQPECSDYFHFNGFYYLIYSNFGRARYFISSEPFGPWSAPENNYIGDEGYRVPKASLYHNRIIFAGFRACAAGYGGAAEFMEALQEPDGTLSFTDVKEMG